MKITGIICEYNPFHEGHKDQIEYLKKHCGTHIVVALMSGDYVQRGEPSVFDKYTRATMALENGVDMVFELPLRFSVASAGVFAKGSILSLASLSFVDSFCFGSECNNLTLLKNVANILLTEPDIYKDTLTASQKNGYNYASSKEHAIKASLENVFFNKDMTDSDITDSDITVNRDLKISNEDINNLFLPNSTLGIEYIKTAMEYNLNLTPIVIKRPIGSNNVKAHDIRKKLSDDGKVFVTLDDFWEIFICKLLATPLSKLSQIGDFNMDIASLFKNNSKSHTCINDFLHACKHKNYTMSRLKRCVLQLVFANETCVNDTSDEKPFIPYLRLLGCSKVGKDFISKIEGTKPIIRLNKDILSLDETSQGEIERDIFASDLYRLMHIKNSKCVNTPDEFKRKLIVVN